MKEQLIKEAKNYMSEVKWYPASEEFSKKAHISTREQQRTV